MAKTVVKLAARPLVKFAKPEQRPKRYKKTSIGRHAKPTNKHARRLRGKNGYRGQGRP